MLREEQDAIDKAMIIHRIRLPKLAQQLLVPQLYACCTQKIKISHAIDAEGETNSAQARTLTEAYHKSDVRIPPLRGS